MANFRPDGLIPGAPAEEFGPRRVTEAIASSVGRMKLLPLCRRQPAAAGRKAIHAGVGWKA